jgi:hypothetical protein
MEYWNIGILGLYCIALKNLMIHEINQPWIEKILTVVLKSSGHGEIMKIDPKITYPNTEVVRF